MNNHSLNITHGCIDESYVAAHFTSEGHTKADLYGLQYVRETGQPLHFRTNNHSFNIAHGRIDESRVEAHFTNESHTKADLLALVWPSSTDTGRRTLSLGRSEDVEDRLAIRNESNDWCPLVYLLCLPSQPIKPHPLLIIEWTNSKKTRPLWSQQSVSLYRRVGIHVYIG